MAVACASIGSISLVLDGRFMLGDDALVHAQPVGRVRLVFQHTQLFGWQAHLHSDDDAFCLLTFPWTDHFDRVLIESSETLPFGRALDPCWSDEDQCWFAEVALMGDQVFVAETEDLPYVMVPSNHLGAAHSSFEPPNIEGLSLAGQSGTVRVNDAEVRIFSVPAPEWERAWTVARESCLAGTPEPKTRNWIHTAAHRAP